MSGDDEDDDGGEVKEEKGGRGVHLRDNRGLVCNYIYIQESLYLNF